MVGLWESLPQPSADQHNTLQSAAGRALRGAVNPDRMAVIDAWALAHHIKRVGRFFGADIVGIAAIHPAMLSSGSRAPDDGSASNEGGRLAVL